MCCYVACLPSAPPPTARECEDRGIPGRAQSSTSRFGPFDDSLTARVLAVVATPDLSGVAGDRFASTPKTRAWQTVNGPARALLSPDETGAEQFRGVSAGRDSPFERSALATRASCPQQGPRVLLPAHHAAAPSLGEVLVRG